MAEFNEIQLTYFEEKEVSSNETMELSEKQEGYYLIGRDDFDELDAANWKLKYNNDGSIEKEQLKKFFDAVSEIRTIPVYEYIIHDLSLRYHIVDDLQIDKMKERLEELWKYIEAGTLNLSTEMIKGKKRQQQFRERFRQKIEEGCPFEKEDYEMWLSLIMGGMKEDYLQNGDGRRRWEKYFKELLMVRNRERTRGRLESERQKVRELALGLHLSYDKFAVIRRKVFKMKSVGTFKREDLLVSFVLKYAEECGYDKYFEAYEMLQKLYPKVEQKKEVKEDKSTQMITRGLEEYLEEDGKLKEAFRESLFTKTDSRIAEELEMIQSIDLSKKQSRARKTFFKELKELEAEVEQDDIVADRDAWEEKLERKKKRIDSIKRKEKEEEKNGLGEQLQKEKQKKDSQNSEDEYKLYYGKQNMYRYLYGGDIIKRGENRNIPKKRADFVLIRPEQKDYFLDSEEFLNTFLNDNVVNEFPEDEERQRNLLLTVVFLKYLLKGRDETEPYMSQWECFEYDVANPILCKCNFQLLYSGNAYDAFLKLLMSCEDSLELFRAVWKIKAES